MGDEGEGLVSVLSGTSSLLIDGPSIVKIGPISREEWKDVGQRVNEVHRWSNFFIGDLILLAEASFGIDEAVQLVAEVFPHVQDQHLLLCRRVAVEFPKERRLFSGLDWSHYRNVCTSGITTEDQVGFLVSASANDTPARHLYDQVVELKKNRGVFQQYRWDLADVTKEIDKFKERLFSKYPVEHHDAVLSFLDDLTDEFGALEVDDGSCDTH